MTHSVYVALANNEMGRTGGRLQNRSNILSQADLENAEVAAAVHQAEQRRSVARIKAKARQQHEQAAAELGAVRAEAAFSLKAANLVAEV